jgi:hypothetical protein
MMTYESFIGYCCPDCGIIHESLESAKDCCEIEGQEAFRCLVCHSRYLYADTAQWCCSLEGIRSKISDLEIWISRDTGELTRRLSNTRAQSERDTALKVHIEQNTELLIGLMRKLARAEKWIKENVDEAWSRDAGGSYRRRRK